MKLRHDVTKARVVQDHTALLVQLEIYTKVREAMSQPKKCIKVRAATVLPERFTRAQEAAVAGLHDETHGLHTVQAEHIATVLVELARKIMVQVAGTATVQAASVLVADTVTVQVASVQAADTVIVLVAEGCLVDDVLFITSENSFPYTSAN